MSICPRCGFDPDHPSEKEVIAFNVKRLRKARGWRMREFGERMGFGDATSSNGQVTQVESGRHHPRPETLQRIAAALGVSVADLYAPISPNGSPQ